MESLLPTVSIILPTLGRPDGLERCLRSIVGLDYPGDKVDIFIFTGEGTVPEKVQEGVKQAKGEYLVYAANDMEFDPACLREAIKDSREQESRLVSFNGGPLLPDRGNICEHFLIHRSLVGQLENGQIFSTDFHHVGCDNWLWAQAEMLDEAFHSERARVIHRHFSKNGTMDEVYEKGWSKVEEDRETLKRKLNTLK